MSKQLTTAVSTQLDGDHRVRVLVEIALDGATLRYVHDKANLVFPHGTGDTYTAKALKVSGLGQKVDGQIGRVTVRLDNVAKDMAGYAASVLFAGRVMTIKRVFLDADLHAPVSANDYVEVFRGRIEAVKEIGRQDMQVTATEGEPLRGRAVNRYYAHACNNRFGDAFCNADGNADLTTLTATGTADSGSTTTLADNALTQVDDFWNYGLIEITHNGILYRRIVKGFDAATDTITLDLALPVTIDTTSAYTVYKGCDKTKATCGGAYAYGPSSDNTGNLGGFVHATSKS